MKSVVYMDNEIKYINLFQNTFINPKRKGEFIEGTCPKCGGKIWGHIKTSAFNCRKTSCILSSGNSSKKGTAKTLCDILNIPYSQDEFPSTETSTSQSHHHKYPLTKLPYPQQTLTHSKILNDFFKTCKDNLINESESFPSLYRKLLIDMGFSFQSIQKFGYTSLIPYKQPKEFPSLVIPYYDENNNITQLKFIRYFNRLKKKQSKEVTKPQELFINNTEITLNNKNTTYGSWYLRDDDKPIIVVEGELKAELLQQWKYCAISIGGTEPPEDYKSLVAERDIVIMLDSDAAGRDSISKLIRASKDAHSIRTIDLFPESVDKPDPNDIIEFSKLKQESAKDEFDAIFVNKSVPLKDHKDAIEGKIFTLEELFERKLEHETEWILKGIIPNRGVSIVFAPPRMGKTFWLIDICQAIAGGKEPMNATEFAVSKGKVLYISLEDTLQSFRERAEHLGLNNAHVRKNFHIAVNWRPFQNDSGINDIQRWIHEHENAKLVVIDTYVTVKSRQKESSKASGYEFGTEELTKLRKLCRLYNIGIILVWHTTKATMSLELESINKDNFMQYAMDSTSLTASTDSAIMLFRQAERNNEGKLLAKPKTGPAIELNMHYSEEKCKWEIIKEPITLNTYSPDEIRMLEILYHRQEAGIKEIASATKISIKEVCDFINSLTKKKFIQKRLSGKYTIANNQFKTEIENTLKIPKSSSHQNYEPSQNKLYQDYEPF